MLKPMPALTETRDAVAIIHTPLTRTRPAATSTMFRKRPSASRISATRSGGSSAAAAGRRQASAKNMPPTQTMTPSRWIDLSRAYPTTDLRTGMRCGRCASSIVARRSGCDRNRRCGDSRSHNGATLGLRSCAIQGIVISIPYPRPRMAKTCATCHAENRDDAQFCRACGTSFVATPTPPHDPDRDRHRSAPSAASRTSPASATARSAAST